MNSKSISTLLLAVATILFIFLCLHLLNGKAAIESNKRLLLEQISKMGVKEFSFNMNKAMTGLEISNVMCVTRDREEKLLSKLIYGRPTLIYRYIQTSSCRPCYEEQIRLVQEVFENHSLSIVILASYDKLSDFLFSARNNLEVPMHLISFDAFNWQLDKAGVPYYFVLHPNMKISNIYIPNEHEPELNRQYLESIKRLLQ